MPNSSPSPEQARSVGEETALGMAVFFDQGSETPIPTYAEEQLEHYRHLANEKASEDSQENEE